MKAEQAAQLFTTSASQSRRNAAIDGGLQSILSAIRRAAEEGSSRVNFQIPRDFSNELVGQLESLGYDVGVGETNRWSEKVEVAISWMTAIERRLKDAR